MSYTNKFHLSLIALITAVAVWSACPADAADLEVWLCADTEAETVGCGCDRTADHAVMVSEPFEEIVVNVCTNLGCSDGANPDNCSPLQNHACGYTGMDLWAVESHFAFISCLPGWNPFPYQVEQGPCVHGQAGGNVSRPLHGPVEVRVTEGAGTRDDHSVGMWDGADTSIPVKMMTYRFTVSRWMNELAVTERTIALEYGPDPLQSPHSFERKLSWDPATGVSSGECSTEVWDELGYASDGPTLNTIIVDSPPNPSLCGLGFEVALLLPALRRMRR